MKTKQLGLGLLISLLMSMTSWQAVAKEPPVAKLVQIEGQVEYSRNGAKWSPVERTKYLFSGYHIRTGEDGSGTLVSQDTGISQQLGANSQIEIQNREILVISGSLSEGAAEESSLFASLTNKFAKAQRYTTVRRSVVKGEAVCDNKVRTIKDLTISASHSDLVWRNACPENTYKLVIDGGEPITVPVEASSEMVRYSVAGLGEGEHTYRVEVTDKDGAVYAPKSDSTFRVLTPAEETELTATLAQVGDDVFVGGNLLEEKGMYVAAMDSYREYFTQYPDDNEMRPLLIAIYQELKLSNLRESEAKLYNAGLEEEI